MATKHLEEKVVTLGAHCQNVLGRFVFRRVFHTVVRSAIGRQPSSVNTSGSDTAAESHLGQGHAPS